MKRLPLRYFWILIAVAFLAIIWFIVKDRSYFVSIPPPSATDSQFTMRENYAIRLVAKEPDVVNPMSVCVDRHGAIYVSESSTYRYGMEGSPEKDSLLLNPIKRIALGANGKPDKVTIVAQGFANPVMGIDIARDKFYATCLNELFVMDIDEEGRLSNKQVLVRDSAHPWNPFGMYRVAVGPDGKLWLAMADHPDSKPVTLTGSDGKVLQLRGQSGGFVRCNPDGSDLELVVQGFRAPFAFDFDPWGHLWAISNGESSPNIYVDVIPGMDYGYHSRKVSYAWLAGKTNLSPPVTEMGSGANTVALHYYGSMFPADFWGSILVANWGSHGAFPTNRIVRQFVKQMGPVPDSVKIVGEEFREAEPLFLTATDSMFRPVSMAIAPDGGLYLADWHGRDDESDTTGRIFKISYTGRIWGKNQFEPERMSRMQPKELSRQLGSSNKFVRREARYLLVDMGEKSIAPLRQLIEKGNAFGAANAIWTLTQLQSKEAIAAISEALNHKDARVRALALRQMRQAAGWPIGGAPVAALSGTNIKRTSPVLMSMGALADKAAPLLQDADPEVRVEAALCQNSLSGITKGLINALEIADSKRLRYQIGFELGRNSDSAALMQLYDTTDPVKYRVALIAGQTAVNEKTPLASAVSGWDFSKDENIGEGLVAKLESGAAFPKDPADRMIAMEWLEAHPRALNPNLTGFILDCLQDGDYLVKGTALRVVRQRGLQNRQIEEKVRHIMVTKDTLFAFLPVEAMFTVASFSDPGPAENWLNKIRDTSEHKKTEILRALRQQSRNAGFMKLLWPDALAIAKTHPGLAEEFAFTFKKAGIDNREWSQLPQPPIRPAATAALSKLIADGVPKASARRGKWTFYSSCISCHANSVDDNEFRLGPNLFDIGSSSQPEYLIESILEPNKVLKTGYQLETIETKDGKKYQGQVETLGEEIAVRRPGEPTVTISMEQVKTRSTSHLSPMPEGLYRDMTVGEVSDLIAYLRSLKGGN